MITRISSLFVIIACACIVRAYPYGELSGVQGVTAFSLGLVILGGYLLGELISLLTLPRITGYLLAGMLAGPCLGGMLSQATVKNLTLIDQIALSLIALSAGGELRLDTLRKQWKGIVSITLSQTIGVFVLGTAAFALTSAFFPFMRDDPWTTRIAAGLVFGAISVAQSPATTIALISETRSKGVCTDITLGTAVLKDVMVIILFTITLSVDHLLELEGASISMQPFISLGGELLFSILTGLATGWGIAFFLSRVNSDPVLFLLAFSYLISVGSHSIHLDPVLICVVAGIWVTNTTEQGEKLLSIIGKGSLVIYVIFFCVAGAALDLNALQTMSVLAVLLTLIRMALLALTTGAGVAIAKPPIRSPWTYWMGFLPQAGVSLGLVMVLRREAFWWGDKMATLLVACIALNQIFGPILMKIAFQQSGETRAASNNRTAPDEAKSSA